jgi:hypothetical protein
MLFHALIFACYVFVVVVVFVFLYEYMHDSFILFD